MEPITRNRLFQSQLIIFDLDGTLCETMGDIRLTFLESLRRRGLDPARGGPLTIGPPLESMMRSGMGPDAEQSEVEAVAAEFRTIYSECNFDASPFYPGIEMLLRHLSEAGKQLALATLKREQPTLRLMEKRGVLSLFTPLIGCDSRDRHWTKEQMIRAILDETKFDPAEAIFFGDSAGDIEAGRRHGVPTVACLYGYGDHKELLAAKPDYLCEQATTLADSVPANAIDSNDE